MSTLNAVQQAFDRVSRGASFEKKSGAWYRQCDEVIVVVDLQKSQYGPQYYVNLAFWLRALGDERYPKPWKSHVQVRLGSLLSTELSEHAERLLDLDQEMPLEQRVERLTELLAESMIPVVERGCSLEGLRSMITDGTLKGAAIRGAAQERLGISAR